MGTKLLETSCVTCLHQDVCKFKEEYSLAIEAVQNAILYPKCEDRLIKEQKVNHLEFIEICAPRCKHYRKIMPTTRDISYDGPIFTKGE